MKYSKGVDSTILQSRYLKPTLSSGIYRSNGVALIAKSIQDFCNILGREYTYKKYCDEESKHSNVEEVKVLCIREYCQKEEDFGSMPNPHWCYTLDYYLTWYIPVYFKVYIAAAPAMH